MNAFEKYAAKELLIRKLAIYIPGTMAILSTLSRAGGPVSKFLPKEIIIARIVKARRAGKPWDAYLSKSQIQKVKAKRVISEAGSKMKRKGIQQAGKKFSRGPF